MNRVATLTAVLCLSVMSAMAQANTDVYHVHFAKAAPGQAKALEAELAKQDPKAPMPGHFLLLRHQDGDDWDYVTIEHLGKKFTIDPAGYSDPPQAAGAPATGAWHTDTFASGPSWEVFAKEMGLAGDTAKMAGSVYILATWRAAPGHRAELLKALNAAPAAGAKVQSSNLTLTHMEGGPWQFLTLSRFNSWQDYATDEQENQDSQGWYDVRQHGVWHHDTIATRVAAK